MAEFDYCVPNTLEEASRFLLEHREAQPIAGGTDLLVNLRARKVSFRQVVDLAKLQELEFITFDGKGAKIGALTKISVIEKETATKPAYGALYDGARLLASSQIRNIATLGGNLCNAAPSADLAPPLLVLNALAKIFSADGCRQVHLEQFFKGPGATVLGEGELLKEIAIPEPSKDSRSGYFKHTIRRSMDIAVAGVALLLVVDNGIFKDIRIALGAVAPTPIRARKAEEFFRHKEAVPEVIAEGAAIVAAESKPISDIRASAEYRREIIKVLVQRGIKNLL